MQAPRPEPQLHRVQGLLLPRQLRPLLRLGWTPPLRRPRPALGILQVWDRDRDQERGEAPGSRRQPPPGVHEAPGADRREPVRAPPESNRLE